MFAQSLIRLYALLQMTTKLQNGLPRVRVFTVQ